MQIDLRTVSIKQQRNTFDHLARRFGDKPASRYQEGSYDIQATENLHYRPTWDPDQLIYDASITRIVMADWYALKDPRQYFYNNYTLARARQQETAEANFSFVESRGLADMLPEDLKRVALEVLVPLRHAAWGANMNNSFISGYGYAAIFTQACMFHAMDNLGIAQYLSRLGLLLGDQEALTEGKTAWLDDEAWQPMRRYIEDCLVVRDPFELFVAQNVALDGLLYPLVYERIVDGYLSAKGASAVAMLCQFMNDWFDETRKWVDAVMKVAAAESEHNRAILQEWTEKWSARAAAAMLPVVGKALGADAEEVVGEEVAAFKARLKKVGVEI
ncbi:MAG: aromatic/alkene monooxygenase hydroxylase subunit beta [Gammaproteobacteria bacterium]|nr:aromatic/alkene monooxygenase hydroxylase subunit beta [Gammaproteobacteria bacterium]MBU1602717.1 aromatic/alkene monooxygenase hydroxylase subunit beta [Gammaproteobacteria bacterium]MBU2433522.1 aromatic/alkene monooxygenase hydroxylase subunit beta [Gammaproteobacteria bacterium]MBU2451438.1 aromatic/alkene monooxygenase hydroxylase subunit beta [Gammaproteobacteria bacterium]